jgi:aminomethyltransferase
MDWEGWLWPNHFGAPTAEHRAVRESVGIWDESPLRKWDFTGPDALRAADRIFTNDMLGLARGQIRYAPFCDDNGTMVGDGTVFKFDDGHAWVITALDSDLDHFEDVVRGLDVQIEPITAELPHVQLQGPRSRELLAGVCDADVAGLRYFHFFPEQVRRRRAGVGLEDGLLGRAGVRDLLRSWRRTPALVRAHRRGRIAVRPRGRRDTPHRVGTDLHRLRLLPAPDEPVRHVAGQGDPAGHR